MNNIIGYAALQILPVMKGTSNNLAGELGVPLIAAGKKAGKDTGKAIASGMDSAKAAVSKATADMAKSQDKVADSAGKLTVAQAKYQTLLDRGVTDAGRLAAAEEAVAKAKRENTRVTGEHKNAVKTLEDANKKLASSTDEVTDNMDKLDKKSFVTGESLVKFGAIAGAGIAAAGAALFKIGSDFAEMGNNIRVGTGASGEALDGLIGVAKDLGTQVPATFEDIGTTVADLNTRLGLTGAPLQTLSAQFLELGNMGIDADINDVAGAFKAFGVPAEDMSGKLDELFQVSQATGVSVNDLAVSAVKGGPALQQFGFGIGQSAALVGTLDKAGLDADKTLGSMNKALLKFAEDGKDPQQALYGTVVELENLITAGKEGAALDLAGGLFGTKGAGQFVEAVRNGTLSVDDFVSATGATSDTILGVAEETRTFSDQWMLFKNEVLVGLEPLATAVFGAITDGMTWIKDVGGPAIARFGEVLSSAFAEGGPLESFSTIAQDVGGAIIPALSNALDLAKGAFEGITEAVTNTTNFFKEHQIIAGTVASVILIGLLPSLVSLTVGWVTSGIAAVTSGASTAGVWIMLKAQAVGSAAVQVAAQYRTVAGWVAHSVSAVASGAAIVGSYIAAGASAVLQAGISAAAWVGSSARTVGALALQGAAFLAQKGIMAAGAIATGIMTAAQWALNTAMSANPIGLIVVALVGLVAAIVIAYKNSETFRNIVAAAWDGIQKAVSFAWDNVISPIIDLFVGGIKKMGEFVSWLWNEAVMPAFNGIGSLISLWWDGVTFVFDLFMAGVRGAGDVVSWLYNEAIRPAFDGIRSVIDGVMGFLEPLWERFKNGLSGIGDMASSVGSGMRSAFDGVVGVIKAPIRAIGQLLASIPDKLFGFEIPGASAIKNWGNTLQNLREGGAVAGRKDSGLLYGPGSGTSDSIWGIDQGGMPVARVSRGEWVTPENAVNAKTVPLLEALRRGWTPPANFLSMAAGATSLAMQGDYTSSLRTAFGIEEDDPRVSAILDFRKGIKSLPGFAGGGFVAANQLVDFARGVEGEEYDWSGVNWGDCSGAVSALANYATGRDAFGSRFATGTEDSELAARGFLPGLGPMGSLNVGWFNGGPYGGHTAATLPDGTNFEMGGARGNGQFGGGAAGANDPSFTDHAHLPPDFFLGGDLGSPTFGDVETSFGDSGGSGGGGAFAGGGAGVTSGGGSGGGTYSGSGNVSSTGASAVFVTNWPSNGSGSYAASSPGITQTDDASSNYGASEDPEDPYKKWQDEQTTGWRDWSKDALKEVFGDVLGPIGLGGQAGVHIENMYAMDERKAAEELERSQKNRTDTYGGRFR